MKKLIILFATLATITACTEEERPASQAKKALDSAQHAADQAVQHAQEMSDRANELFNKE